MGFHRGWFGSISTAGEKPNVTWALLKRVLTYAQPYRVAITALLFTILLTTGLSLLTPLIFRSLIDNALPKADTRLLNMLALGLVGIPILTGIIGVFQRRLNASIGEGVIYDLRVSLYSHLQRMSLNFFTNTKVGELMSRLNNDVVGAQRAISNTIVDIITNIIELIGVLAVMLSLEWRLTLLSIIVLPAFIIAARRLGGRLREIAREAMDHNAQMNAMMNETLNIGGVLLVKLFGRSKDEVDRFQNRAGRVRDMGITRAVTGQQLFVIIGLVSAVGTAVIYWVGGHFVIDGVFTVGLIVAFASYLGQLYGSLQALTNAPVDFATSMVSFERVFELLDLPLDIAEKDDAIDLREVKGALAFEDVMFRYTVSSENLLSDVRRYGQMDNVKAVLSGETPSRENREQTESASTGVRPVSRRWIMCRFRSSLGSLSPSLGLAARAKRH
jgi:ATP-binding cassette subfamily B protein